MSRIAGNKWSMALNATSAVIVSYGCYLIHQLVLPTTLAEAGHFQFLTNLLAVFTLVYYATSLIAHTTHSQRVFYWKNNYILPVVLALEFVVSTVYWLLKIFFIDLILEKKVPFDLDFCVHIVPFVSLAIDYYVFLPAVELSHSSEFLICAALTNGYWLWLNFLIDPARGQSYPYPFLNVPTTQQRAAIFLFVGTLAFVGFAFMRWIHEKIIPKPPSHDKKIQ